MRIRAGGLFLVLLAAGVLFLARPATAAEPIEVGYIENIKGNAAKIVLTRAGKNEPVIICGLVYNGDRIAVTDPKAKITLRLSGKTEPVVIGPENGEFRVAVAEPKNGFLSGLVRWAAASIGDLDKKARSPMAMSVRDGPNGRLAAPLIAEKQLVAAGKRSLTIGWRGAASMAEVKVTNAKGEVVASGRGSGRVWTSPAIDLAEGAYRIELSTPRERISGEIEAVAASALPQAPRDLAEDRVPRALGAAVQAAWLASQGRRFGLEAFQLVTAVADSAPAGVVADALVAGEAISAAK